MARIDLYMDRRQTFARRNAVCREYHAILISGTARYFPAKPHIWRQGDEFVCVAGGYRGAGESPAKAWESWLAEARQTPGTYVL